MLYVHQQNIINKSQVVDNILKIAVQKLQVLQKIAQ